MGAAESPGRAAAPLLLLPLVLPPFSSLGSVGQIDPGSRFRFPTASSSAAKRACTLAPAPASAPHPKPPLSVSAHHPADATRLARASLAIALHVLPAARARTRSSGGDSTRRDSAASRKTSRDATKGRTRRGRDSCEGGAGGPCSSTCSVGVSEAPALRDEEALARRREPIS
jgi:hypothetical protein